MPGQALSTRTSPWSLCLPTAADVVDSLRRAAARRARSARGGDAHMTDRPAPAAVQDELAPVRDALLAEARADAEAARERAREAVAQRPRCSGGRGRADPVPRPRGGAGAGAGVCRPRRRATRGDGRVRSSSGPRSATPTTPSWWTARGAGAGRSSTIAAVSELAGGAGPSHGRTRTRTRTWRSCGPGTVSSPAAGPADRVLADRLGGRRRRRPAARTGGAMTTSGRASAPVGTIRRVSGPLVEAENLSPARCRSWSRSAPRSWRARSSRCVTGSSPSRPTRPRPASRPVTPSSPGASRCR